MKIVTSSCEHLLPDAVRGGEVAALERDALHPREDLVGASAPPRPTNGSIGVCRKRDFFFMRRH